MPLTIEEMATFCKKKGFVFPSSEIYGGFAGFWDFGPLGVEMFNALKAAWWQYFVRSREDIVGLDASIISHPQTWVASGHLESFGDLVLITKKSKTRIRADHFIQEQLGMQVEGWTAARVNELLQKHKLTYHGEDFEELKDFNLLFETKVGADASQKGVAYLRGETAQAMFMDFKLVAETARMQLPFGIAQAGRCFRNEIAPRDFLFRSREFHIAEMEYFYHPEQKGCPLLTAAQRQQGVLLLDAAAQEKQQEKKKGTEKSAAVKTTVGEMLQRKLLNEWHASLLAEQLRWLLNLGFPAEKLRLREHLKTELSHYSSATFDVEYEFPFGWKEIAGNANRGQYDLTQHAKHSQKKLELHDEATKKSVTPAVIEPTFGMERIFLALLFEAYHDDKQRGNVVLKLPPRLAPYFCGIFPLVKNKPEIAKKARTVFEQLRGYYTCFYDDSGSIGRRYARADEIGIPFCMTVDFESLDDDAVTIRDRNTTKQERVPLAKLQEKLTALYCK
ncbi:glycine--tRNA ligase [Candidatus Woesearchaeota archaeon]|nr:glycine--tRNA ligase [Candidatus Woesearchaeota archaeon]